MRDVLLVVIGAVTVGLVGLVVPYASAQEPAAGAAQECVGFVVGQATPQKNGQWLELDKRVTAIPAGWTPIGGGYAGSFNSVVVACRPTP